jgi:RNA ligase (TIGR02306 family)
VRSLASVQRITDIQPIPGADAIEVASVLGWKVVVKKGEFAVGDLAVYLEIDSVPPDDAPYRFLWKNTEMRPNNFRIRTVKLRGQVSQGILFPLSLFGDFQSTLAVEGLDVTNALDITKYEAPLPAGSGNIEGQFFDGVPKTDEERVQSETGMRHLAALQGRPYYITEKCDGSSMTVAVHNGVAKVASRNYRLSESADSAYWRAANANNSALLYFVTQRPNLAVQGELVGPGIQSNRLGLDNHKCLVFTIYDRDLGVRLSWVEMEEYAQHYQFDLVPVVTPPTYGFDMTQEDLLSLAEGKYTGTNNEREGIVIRSADPYEQISFKAISNRYLLKGGE